ncbi:MAG: hypothetical protein U5L96_04995 [Owenweeksia sp.]|nr:hypothetical protein [Owenweeksia sp.]
MDNNGRPIGVQTSATTGSASSGDLDVILRHEPNKDGPGVANGDITNAGGETDVQVNFQVSIN